MKEFTVTAILGITLALTGCSSSSSSDTAPTGGTSTANDTSGNTAAGDTSGTTVAGDTAGNTSGTNTTDGDTSGGSDLQVSLLDAGLSHVGTPVPSTAAIANDPQVLSSGSQRAANLPNSPAVIYEVVRNQGTAAGIDCNAVGAQWNSCSVVNLHVKDSDGTLSDKNWKLYFHSTRRILQVSSNEFNVTHVNGDLHFLSPNDQFTGFAGGVKSVKMVTEYSHLVHTDFQPRYWIERDGVAQLITNTDDENDPSSYAMDITGDNRFEFVGENNPIANSATRFDRNSVNLTRMANVDASEIASRVIPMPANISVSAGVLDISSGFSFAQMDLPAPSISALQARQAQMMTQGTGVPLSATIDSSLASDSYTLTVDQSGIAIAASNQSMLFYAGQSLLSLIQPGVNTIQHVEINDQPQFEYRGMHVDVGRNFHSVASIKKLIDQMGAYKLNKLHMHLSDDEGWRLEIPGLPELTNVGGTRGFKVAENGLPSETTSLLPAMGSGPQSNNQGSGYYTRAQFIDLLQYADARFIEVIPEFDMPAHARAAVVAMRARAYNLGNATDITVRLDDPADTSRYLTVQNYNDSFINPCVPGTYNFLQTLVTEVKGMYSAANLPLNKWHMGGDEASNILLGAGIANPDTASYDQPWARSPVCAAFISDTAEVADREALSAYFVKRVSQIVADAGISTLYAYQDIYRDLSPSDFNTLSAGINHWVTLSNANPTTSSNAIGSANDFANRGFETVIGAPDYLYFDFPYEVDPKERGYYWATRQLDTEKLFKFSAQNLAQNAATSVERYGNPWTASNQGTSPGYAGIQGFVWSETIRTPEQFDYMIYPRMLSLAERAWHKPFWELPVVSGETFSATSGQVNLDVVNNDYANFAAAIAAKELPKLDAASVNYRIPPPGAKLVGGVVQMNTNFPGLILEYSTDGANWQVWNAANPPISAAFVRSRTANGARASRVTPFTSE